MNLLEKFLGEFPEEERRSSIIPSSLFKDPKQIDFKNWFLNSELDLRGYDTSTITDMSQMFNDSVAVLSEMNIERRNKNV